MKNTSSWTLTIIAGVAALMLSSCGGSTSTQPPPHISTWTWVGGANISGQPGVYGTQGTGSPSNVPGSRQEGVSWTDKSGNFWLFGGDGQDSTGAFGLLNDLWKFDGKNWTWVSGANVPGQMGVYGTQGAASSSNMPGARDRSTTWTDRNGNLWLFGGGGRDSVGTSGGLNDLWKFDGNAWTWVSGSSTVDQSGVYGTQGTAVPSNVPGARVAAISWIDSSGNLWLFGAVFGFDFSRTLGSLNDLWKFDGTNWTWISGSTTINQSGVYGTLGMASPSNIPGARGGSASWIDRNGNLWLFGGSGLDSTGTGGSLNDLWKFDGNNWTWVGGSNTVNQSGVYGTKGTPSPSNVPGGREGLISWTDAGGNFWLFGGVGFDSTGAQDALNDLWKFDGTNWTWIGGANTVSQTGVYGTLGTASPSNVPGARQNAISGIDSSGNLWLFGGDGIDSTGKTGLLNDLWRYTP
jgi:N-acetylneuraminic acid mutarotase